MNVTAIQGYSKVIFVKIFEIPINVEKNKMPSINFLKVLKSLIDRRSIESDFYKMNKNVEPKVFLKNSSNNHFK